MNRFARLLPLALLGGCIHPPDRITLGINYDDESHRITGGSIGTQLPITYGGEPVRRRYPVESWEPTR